MSELSSMHYEPRKAVETLTATMQLLLTRWYDMPESARAQLDAQRSALATQLTQASQFQRGQLPGGAPGLRRPDLQSLAGARLRQSRAEPEV